MRELDEIARSLPEVSVAYSRDDRPEYRVRGKLFLCLRGRRKDALDPETGEPLDDVLMFRTPSLEDKERLLAEEPLCFTTPHFDGYPAVLMLARDLGRAEPARLRQLIERAWLSQAPKRLARAWSGGRERSR
jgi:hypothetical protein